MLNISAGSDTVGLTLFHVSDSLRDIEVALTSNGMGVYTSDSASLVERLTQPGIWYLEVKDHDSGWRLRDRVVTPLGEFTLGQHDE